MLIKNSQLSVFIVVLLSGCASIPTHQANKLKPFSAQGWGGTTCAEMLSDIDPNNSNKDIAGLNIGLYQSWISGFISGTNYAESEIYDVSGNSTPEQSFAWIQNYCIENPEVAVPLAMHELILAWQQENIVLREAKQ